MLWEWLTDVDLCTNFPDGVLTGRIHYSLVWRFQNHFHFWPSRKALLQMEVTMNTRKYRKILYRYWKVSWIYLKLLVSITDKTFGSTEQTHLSSSYKIFWGWKTWKQILDPFQSHYCTDSTVTMSRFDIKYGFTKVCKELHEFKNTFAFRNCFIFLNLEWINCAIPLE